MSICQGEAETSQRQAWKFFCADLIEHVLETEGDAYMKTLDDELSFLVRNSLDTHASLGALVALVGALLWKLSRVSVRYVMGSPGKHQNALLLPHICRTEKKVL